MIIEFLGNSGAGKSTLIPVVKQLLGDAGLIAMSATEAVPYYMRKTILGRIISSLTPQARQRSALWIAFYYVTSTFYIAQFGFQNRQLVHYVIKSQLRRRISWRHRRLILRLFFEMTASYHFLKCRAQADEILIFDEAFVHRAVHMFVSQAEQPAPDQVLEYLKLLPQSDVVILVQTPLPVCLERIRARGLQVRLRSLEAHDVERFMANAEQVVNIASGYLKAANWQVIEVENEGDLERCRAELRRNLAQYLLLPQPVG